VVTGKIPFDGETSAVIFDAILNRDPVSPIRLNPLLPVRLEDIINRALEKDRDLRYQSAAELRSELKRLKRDTSSGKTAFTSAASETTADSRRSSSVPPAASSSKPSSAAAASSAHIILGEAKKHKLGLFISLIIVALVVIGVFALAHKWHDTSHEGLPFERASITRVTESGKTVFGSISPDGRYVAYVLRESVDRSLWVRQLATGSNVQIVAPAEGGYLEPTFTPDGNYIYYGHQRKENPAVIDVYSVPSLGGQPRRIVANAFSVSFSPDGKQISFIRPEPTRQESRLMIANADGSEEHEVAVHKASENFQSDTSWSPDGKLIAVPAVHLGRGADITTLNFFSPDDGHETVVPLKQFLLEARWLPGGSGLMMLAFDSRTSFFSPQLWFLKYPGGTPQRVTHDLNSYFALSLTADGKKLTTIEQEIYSSILVGPGRNIRAALPINTEKSDGSNIEWTPEGKLLVQNAGLKLFLEDSSGNNRTELLPDLTILNYSRLQQWIGCASAPQSGQQH